MPTRVLLTGITGFIGSHLAERLVDAGDSVVGIDSFTTYYDPAVKRRNIERLMGSDSFRMVEGSLREWVDAYDHGHVRVSGDPAVTKLIGNVIQRQLART